MDIRKLIKGFGAVIAGLIVVSVTIWMAQNGSLEVTLPGGSQGATKYRLVSHATGKEISAEGQENQRSFRLKSGGYDVLVESDAGTYSSVASVPGWFGKATVSASLQPEYGREFIGNNTDSCPLVINETLISYPCGGSASSIKVQIPATATSPPYTYANRNPKLVNLDDAEEGGAEFASSVEGTFVSNDVTYALVSFTGDGAWQSGHYIYRLTSNSKQAIASSPEKHLTKLDASSKYSVIPSGSGFVAYSSNFNHLVYYDSPAAEGSELSGYSPDSSGLGFVEASGGHNILAGLYSNIFDTGAKPRSEVVVGVNNIIIKTKLGKAYSAVTVCGSDLICMIDVSGLDVFQVSDNKLSELYHMASIKNVYALGDEAYLQSDSGILAFDLTQRQGYMAYHQGDYEVESVVKTSGKLIITVRDSSSDRYALELTKGVENSGIDSKFVALKASSATDGVVIYKNIIHVKPRLGEMIFDAASHSFTYSAAQRKEGDQRVSRAVTDAGIDTAKYRVINLSK